MKRKGKSYFEKLDLPPGCRTVAGLSAPMFALLAVPVIAAAPYNFYEGGGPVVALLCLVYGGVVFLVSFQLAFMAFGRSLIPIN